MLKILAVALVRRQKCLRRARLAVNNQVLTPP